MSPSPPSAKPTLPALASLPVAPVAVLLSFLFSALVILQHPLLNDDAYSYLHAAQTFNTSGALAVLESYGWYSYSILIALLDRVLPGDLITAAHLLNTACHALLTWVFILLSAELRASRRVQIFAALCILGLPLVNEMRYFLIRDTGFWAFALLSLVCLIRFCRTGQLRAALWWCLALCAATAFRLEGLLLLTLAPLSLLLPDGTSATKARVRRCLRLLGVLLATLAGLLLVTLLGGISLVELIAYAYRWYLPLLAELFPLLLRTADAASDNTAVGLLLVLFSDALALLSNLAGALSLPLVVLMLGYRYRQGSLTLAQPGQRLLAAYMGISTLALVLFLLIMHFLTQRYTTLLTLLLLSLVPLMLDELATQAARQGSGKRFQGIFAFFCVYYFVDSLFSFGYSQQHIEDSIAWSQANLPAAAQLKTNNFAIAYHSGRVAAYDKTVRDTASVMQSSTSGDYLLLEIDRDDNTDALDTSPLYLPLTRFANERGDEVRVYRRR